MMLIDPGEPTPFSHQTFREFPSMLTAGDVLVLNDTQVFPARLHAAPHGNRAAPTEVLLTRRVAAFDWVCLCRPARRLRPGQQLHFSDALVGEVIEKNEDGTVRIRFALTQGGGEEAFWSEVESIGSPPLPPYIRRPLQRNEDRLSYQTVYARNRGAVAAPTAGLHFTQDILREIAGSGVDVVYVTLHVGIGTFMPVKVDDVAQHRIDSEDYEISTDAADRLNAAISTKRRIVAAGTTAVRTLESAIRAGHGMFRPGASATSIFITPGFQFRAVDALLTNFHLPESTLLMLVSAFAGMETVRAAYREAIDQKYRFYSYGDCMFIRRKCRDAG